MPGVWLKGFANSGKTRSQNSTRLKFGVKFRVRQADGRAQDSAQIQKYSKRSVARHTARYASLRVFLRQLCRSGYWIDEIGPSFGRNLAKTRADSIDPISQTSNLPRGPLNPQGACWTQLRVGYGDSINQPASGLRAPPQSASGLVCVSPKQCAIPG